MAGFDAAPAELQICGLNLSDISGGLQARLEALQSEVEELFSTGWKGQAANGFRRGWELWQAAAADGLTQLREEASLLNVTGQNYTATDDSAADGVRNAGADL